MLLLLEARNRKRHAVRTGHERSKPVGAGAVADRDDRRTKHRGGDGDRRPDDGRVLWVDHPALERGRLRLDGDR